jgi:predicted dehydrogenase
MGTVSLVWRRDWNRLSRNTQSNGLSSATKREGSNEVKQLAIVGCGDVAFRTYIPGLLAISPKASVVACFDPIAERAERAASLFPNAIAYTSYDALLEHPKLDGLLNLTPAPFHAETTRKALNVGLHVFSEKPIAATVAEGEELAQQARDANLLLLCAPATMTTDRFRWMKALVDTGRLGRLIAGSGQMTSMGPAGWRAYTGDPSVFYAKGVGPVLDTAVYVLHGLTGFFGPVKRVQAMAGIAYQERDVLIPRLLGQKIKVNTSDLVMIQLDFGENRFAQVFSSFAVPATQAPAFELHGSGGTFSVSQAQWYDGTGPVDLFFHDSSPLGAEGWLRSVTPPSPDGPIGEHLIASGPRHFVDCLNGEEQPVLTAEHSIHVLDVILKAEASAREGCAVELTTTF